MLTARTLHIACLYAVFICLSGFALAAPWTVPGDVLLFPKYRSADNKTQGIHAGSLLLNPMVSISTAYDDNIFRTPEDTQSDIVASLRPALAVQTNWQRHGIFFGAEGDFGFYQRYASENYEDYGLLLSGQYDLTDETYAIVALSRARRHLGRGSLLDPVGGAPSEYEVSRREVRFVREPRRLQLELFGLHEDVRLSDVSAAGLPVTAFAGRDNRSIGAELRYVAMPGNALFTGISYHDGEYALPGGAGRKVSGFIGKSGLRLDWQRGMKLGLFATHIDRRFETAESDLRRTYPGASLSWSITALTTLTALLESDFNDTTISGVAGVVRTQRKLALSHQFTRHARAELYGGLNGYDYVGGQTVGINRKTRLRFGGIAMHRHINEHIGFRAAFDRQARSSPIPSDEYDDNRLSLSLVFSY